MNAGPARILSGLPSGSPFFAVRDRKFAKMQKKIARSLFNPAGYMVV